MERLLPPKLVLSQFTRSLDQWRAQGGLVLLYGDQAVLAYALQAIASLLARGEHVVFIDSANAFNPFLIAEVATHLNRPPEELLNRLHISRTFTVHQLEALITERIVGALDTYASRILIASGFLHNLYDEDVELREAWRIFRKAVAHLRTLTDAGILVLVICPTPAVRLPDRDGLLDALIAEADKVIKLEVATLSLEKPVPVSVSPPNISSPKRLDRPPRFGVCILTKPSSWQGGQYGNSHWNGVIQRSLYQNTGRWWHPAVLTPSPRLPDAVSTAMIYTHVLNRGGSGVASPADRCGQTKEVSSEKKSIVRGDLHPFWRRMPACFSRVFRNPRATI